MSIYLRNRPKYKDGYLPKLLEKPSGNQKKSSVNVQPKLLFRILNKANVIILIK